mgnify:CR=1 FL=1
MERLVTTSQAAEILGLSLQGVHYRIKKDQLKSIKKSGKIFVYVDDASSHVNSTNDKAKVEPIINQNTNNNINQKQGKASIQDNTIQNKYFDAVIDGKNDQIELLKRSLKWMKRQYISEISRLEVNQKRIIDVFNSEIKLLQSAFHEMRSVYKPQIEAQHNTTKEQKKEETKFLALKDFFVLMKRSNKSEQEIKYIIFKAIKTGDKRFIYNKIDKTLLILDSDFLDLV